MKQFIRDYFTFNKRERRGVFVLLCIIVSLLLYLQFAHYLVKDETDFTAFEKEIAEIERAYRADTSENDFIQHDYKTIEQHKPLQQRFAFDPNTILPADWKRLGLSDKQVAVIGNYKMKGGKFYKKEDFKKIYGISTKLYAELSPYIVIAKPEKKYVQEIKKEYVKEKIWIELNKADTTALEKLKGIGPSFARRIVKYRDLLGGYVAKDQLREVYGFDSLKWNDVKENVYVDVSTVRTININSATVDEMKKHPYIKYNLARAIVNYRAQHGPYRSINDLQALDLVNGELYQKLSPYLSLE